MQHLQMKRSFHMYRYIPSILSVNSKKDLNMKKDCEFIDNLFVSVIIKTEIVLNVTIVS